MKQLTFSLLTAVVLLTTACQKQDQVVTPQTASARKGADDKPGDDKGKHPEPGDDKGKHPEPGDDKGGGKGGHTEPGDDKGGSRHN